MGIVDQIIFVDAMFVPPYTLDIAKGDWMMGLTVVYLVEGPPVKPNGKLGQSDSLLEPTDIYVYV